MNLNCNTKFAIQTRVSVSLYSLLVGYVICNIKVDRRNLVAMCLALCVTPYNFIRYIYLHSLKTTYVQLTFQFKWEGRSVIFQQKPVVSGK